MAIYCNFKGTSGNVTTKGYEQWIELLEVAFTGIDSHIATAIGRKEIRIKSDPTYGDFYIVKHTDNSSTTFFDYVNNSTSIPSLVIDYVHTDDELKKFMSYTLKNVLISHYSHVANGTAMPLERVGLSYQSIEKQIIPYDSRGIQMSPMVAGYNLTSASKL